MEEFCRESVDVEIGSLAKKGLAEISWTDEERQAVYEDRENENGHHRMNHGRWTR